MKRMFFIVGILLLLSCSHTKDEPEEREPRVEVEVTRVVVGTIEEKVPAFGEVRSEKEVLVSSQFGGRIIYMEKLPGDPVEQNELLATIRRAEAEALSADSLLATEFTNVSLFSPISGRIVERMASPGDVVSAGTPIFKIVAPKPVYFWMKVPGRYFPKVLPGQTVEVYFDEFPNINFKGKVMEKSQNLDPLSRTFGVRATLEDRNGMLLPGLYGKAEITVRSRQNALIIPRQAVLTRQGEPRVFVLSGDEARAREVEMGIWTETQVEITHGLREGEVVVVLGNYELEDGMKVKREDKKE